VLGVVRKRANRFGIKEIPRSTIPGVSREGIIKRPKSDGQNVNPRERQKSILGRDYLGKRKPKTRFEGRRKPKGS